MQYTRMFQTECKFTASGFIIPFSILFSFFYLLKRIYLISALKTAFDEKTLFPKYILDYEYEVKKMQHPQQTTQGGVSVRAEITPNPSNSPVTGGIAQQLGIELTDRGLWCQSECWPSCCELFALFPEQSRF